MFDGFKNGFILGVSEVTGKPQIRCHFCYQRASEVKLIGSTFAVPLEAFRWSTHKWENVTIDVLFVQDCLQLATVHKIYCVSCCKMLDLCSNLFTIQFYNLNVTAYLPLFAHDLWFCLMWQCCFLLGWAALSRAPLLVFLVIKQINVCNYFSSCSVSRANILTFSFLPWAQNIAYLGLISWVKKKLLSEDVRLHSM